VQKDEQGTLMAVFGEGGFRPLVEFLSSVEPDAAYILLDGVCRSGQTLTAIYRHVREVSNRVWTYAIAVSADSQLIPTWYGCLYENNEYVVLTREGATPNTPLFAIGANKGQPLFNSPALVLRPPIQGDPSFDAGSAASIARYTSDDRFFDSITRAKNILVLEWNSEPVGFISFHIEHNTLWIDYIVACQRHKEKKGIGTALYYHVENYAKLRGCDNISLWAISDRVDWYVKRGFNEVHGARKISFGDGSKPQEAYHSMTHRLRTEAGQYHV
jgi:GNAT superfamily N-acetyltransferase